jgi:hypothetical protein
MYTNAQYIGSPSQVIRCDINSVTSFVPLDPANTDYANIMALVASGDLTIGPAE